MSGRPSTSSRMIPVGGGGGDDETFIPIDFSVAVKGLPPRSNPIVGMFTVDPVRGSLNFLNHTEIQYTTGHPKFDKKLTVNYFPGRNQKFQMNVYSANVDNEDGESDILEEDRLGSCVVCLDKIQNLTMKALIAPVMMEYPLWHDGDLKLNGLLQKQGTSMVIHFKAQASVDLSAEQGPKSAEFTIGESLQLIMNGITAYKYPFNSRGSPQKRFIFFDPNDGRLGTVYWCEPGKRKKDKDRCIPLDELKGMYEQNQTKAFIRAGVKAKYLDQCFSLVGQKRTLDLKADSKDQRDGFMFAIHKILTKQGFNVREGTPKASPRVSVSNNPASVTTQNFFFLSLRLRNIPLMPWANDDANDTLVALFEKQGNTFVLVEQTEWVRNNSNPNFQSQIVLPFYVPITSNIVKLVIYDHQFSDTTVVGSAILKTDTLFSLAGQEMMIKLRNKSDAVVDQSLQDNNTYMLLTSIIRAENSRQSAAVPSTQVASDVQGTFTNVMKELGSIVAGGGAGGVRAGSGSIADNQFLKSILSFLSAGDTFSYYPSEKTPVSGLKKKVSVQVYYRSSPPHGKLIFCANKENEVEELDNDGNPQNVLFSISLENLADALSGEIKKHFKGEDANKVKPDRALTLLVKDKSTDSIRDAYAIDLECRNKAIRDAWANGLTDFISYIDDSSDDALGKMDKGGRSAADIARKAGKLQGSSNLFGKNEANALDKFGEEAKNRLSVDTWKSESDDDEDEPDRPSKPDPVLLPPPVVGDGDVPFAPPMFDVILGGGPDAPPMAPDMDGVPGAPPMAPGFSVRQVYTGPKLKRLHWEALEDINIENTLWALVKDDLEDSAGKQLEELFKMADAKSLKKNAAAEDEKSKFKRLLDSKRAQNIEISLKSFRMSHEAIAEAIVMMDMTILTLERLQILLACMPLPEEIKLLNDYMKGPNKTRPVDPAEKAQLKEHLGIAEQFCLTMLDIPRCQMRLHLLSFQSKFDNLVKDMIDKYEILNESAKELRDSDRLKKLMSVILSVGNYLNRGTRSGGAVGFRLSALNKLTDTRSTDNKQTLLDFIVEYMFKIRQKELEDNPGSDDNSKSNPLDSPYLDDLFTPIKESSQIDWKALNEDRELLVAGVEQLERELHSMQKDETERDPRDQFQSVMSAFLEHAQRRMNKMRKKYSEVNDSTTSLIEFFGENSKSMESTELFKIFNQFLNVYKNAEEEGKRRREAAIKKAAHDAARAERDQKKKHDQDEKEASGHAELESHEARERLKRAALQKANAGEEGEEEWDT